jgi:hypothetical protein
MKVLQQEKYDHAYTAFMMYETALRNTDKLMDEFQSEEVVGSRNAYPNKMSDVYYPLDQIGLDEREEKPVKSSRNRNKTRKKVAASQKTDIKMEPLYQEPKGEFLPDVQMAQDEEITCPCGQNKDGDWVGCDMHDKCKHEWFHLS